MADPQPMYLVPTPAKKSGGRHPVARYLLGFIVPGLAFFVVMQIIAWLIDWFT